MRQISSTVRINGHNTWQQASRFLLESKTMHMHESSFEFERPWDKIRSRIILVTFVSIANYSANCDFV